MTKLFIENDIFLAQLAISGKIVNITTKVTEKENFLASIEYEKAVFSLRNSYAVSLCINDGKGILYMPSFPLHLNKSEIPGLIKYDESKHNTEKKLGRFGLHIFTEMQALSNFLKKRTTRKQWHERNGVSHALSRISDFYNGKNFIEKCTNSCLVIVSEKNGDILLKVLK